VQIKIPSLSKHTFFNAKLTKPNVNGTELELDTSSLI